MKTLKILFVQIVISFFLMSCGSALGQNFDSTIKLSVVVKVVDSQYLAIPSIKISNKKTIIKLKKLRGYNNNPDPASEGTIYLQKLIHKMYVNFSTDAIHDRFDLENTQEVFGSNSLLNDTINLKYYYPFENGHYRLRISLKYLKDNSPKEMYSDWYEFDVLFPPKNSLFD